MTTTPAMPELPDVPLIRFSTGHGVEWAKMYTADQMRAYALATLQAQPAVAPTEHIKEPYTLAELNERIASNDYNAELLLHHAMLLLNAQPAAAGVSDAAAWELWLRVCAESDNLSTRVMIANFARAILALRPQAVPMTDEQALGYWKIAAKASSRYSPAEAYYKGIADAEAHHGITAPAGGEGK